jgi:hypothetical protein
MNAIRAPGICKSMAGQVLFPRAGFTTEDLVERTNSLRLCSCPIWRSGR